MAAPAVGHHASGDRTTIGRIGVKNFADRFILRARELGHPLCVGLDLYLDRIPPLFRRGDMLPRSLQTADGVADFCHAVLDQIAGEVAIIKPQIALFEQLGWRGMKILERIIQAAREREILVLLDAKRGDIGSTAEGYATAYLDDQSPMVVDAVTVNPYMGRDAIAPFAAKAREGGRGLVVLVKNSNPSASDYQDLQVNGRTLFEEVAASLKPFQDALIGKETGWSSLCVTTAATRPSDSSRVRAILQSSVFLVLGYGAQGGSPADAVAGFRRGPAGFEGGIVNASRSLLYPPAGDTSDLSTWESAFHHNLSAAIASLSDAVR